MARRAGPRMVGGAATAYVCSDVVCDAPTTDPDRLRATLSR